MNDQELYATLHKIQATLDVILSMVCDLSKSSSNQNQIATDPIRSYQSDQIRSGSDQISKEHSTLIERFKSTCYDYGINPDNKDLSSAIRAIDYFFTQARPNNPKAYITKMLSGLPDSRSVGFKTSTDSNRPPTKLSEIDTTVMGVDIDKINELKPYMDQRTYFRTREFIPKWQTMFSDWNSVSSSELKMNILVAYAINNGLL